MPVNPNAAIEITAFRWVPEFAQGLVRDLRVRWALEEAGLDYRVRLLGQERPPEYLLEQPFDQVPCFNDGEVRIFETGAIVQYLGETQRSAAAARSAGQISRDPMDLCRAQQRRAGDPQRPADRHFLRGRGMGELRRAGAADFARLKLKRVVGLARRQAVARGRPVHRSATC